MKRGMMSTRRWILWAAVVILPLGGVAAATFAKGKPAPLDKAAVVNASSEEVPLEPKAAMPDAAGLEIAANTTSRVVEGPKAQADLKKARVAGAEVRRSVKERDLAEPKIRRNVQEADVPPVGAEPVSAPYGEVQPGVKETDFAGAEALMTAQAPADGGGEGSTQLSLETALETAKAEFIQGTEMNVPYMLSSGEEYAKGRREFIVPMLKALKVLVDAGAPPEEAQPSLPSASTFRALQTVRTHPDGRVETIIATDPARVKKHEEETEARKEANLLLDAWQWRRGITRSIAASYSHPPYATDELRQLATEILQDDAVVNSILAKVAANIAKNTAPQTGAANQP